MAFYDRVRVALASTGTGDLTIGAAAAGYRSFVSAAVPDQSLVSYVIEDRAGAYEIGTGKYDAAANRLTRTVIASSAAGQPINLSRLASLYLSPLAADLTAAVVSLGATSAGKPAGLNAKGAIDFSLLKGSDRYAQHGPTIFSYNLNERMNGSMLQPGSYREAILSIVSTSSPDTDALLTLGKFGEDQRPVVVNVVKGRGSADAPGRVQANDFLYQWHLGAVTLPSGEAGAPGFTDRNGHVGTIRWFIDGPLIDGTYGEAPGTWALATGTGISSSSAFPDANKYYGVQNAIVANSRQQVALPGQTFARQSLQNTRNPGGEIGRLLTPLPTSANPRLDFGANIWIGPGSSEPKRAPIKVDYLNTALLAAPEPGAVEYDGNDLYYTNSAGRRAGMVNNEIVIYSSGVKMSRTGSTDQVALATFTLPANALGPNGYMEARLLVSGTNTANDKRIYIQRATGDNPGQSALIANLKLDGSLAAGFEATCRWTNRGATNVQVSQGLRVNGAPTAPVYAPAAGSAQAIDTTQPSVWTIYGYVSVGTETISIESINIKAVYAA